ncbi:DUF7529 family protein [Halegenticoccus soli]|uniref:DUF7529 family protein n=1 Tax=Halegenticoccus soli TaxID=1985678 RepID=UPI000C6DABCE|nr:hypothetical protein [Halegenticoccus soli]
MPETGNEGADYAERISANADAEKSAWRATLSDAEAMAADLEADGWRTLLVAAGHTAPESPESGTHDRFGLTHVVPGNVEDEFVELFEAGQFPRYEVHRAEAAGRAFVVTTLFDPETKAAILVAGTYELRHAAGCARAAKEAGKMYTHVQKLDGTHLGSFEHDDYEKFFPENVENWIDS